jgi:hypothetical protein
MTGHFRRAAPARKQNSLRRRFGSRIGTDASVSTGFSAEYRRRTKASASRSETSPLLFATCGAERDLRSASPTTMGGKCRVSSKAGRATPSPANFESGSAPVCGRDLGCAELGHAPSPVLARFLLAIVSKRKSGTSQIGSRNGTRARLWASSAAVGRDVDALVPIRQPDRRLEDSCFVAAAAC